MSTRPRDVALSLPGPTKSHKKLQGAFKNVAELLNLDPALKNAEVVRACHTLLKGPNSEMLIIAAARLAELCASAVDMVSKTTKAELKAQLIKAHALVLQYKPSEAAHTTANFSSFADSVDALFVEVTQEGLIFTGIATLIFFYAMILLDLARGPQIRLRSAPRNPAWAAYRLANEAYGGALDSGEFDDVHGLYFITDRSNHFPGPAVLYNQAPRLGSRRTDRRSGLGPGEIEFRPQRL